MPSKRAIFNLAVTAGEILLRNGAEIFRVQETIGRILDAFGVEGYSLYVLSNGVFASLESDEEENCVAIRHVPSAPIHLGRIAAVNDLSRTIVQAPDEDKFDAYMAQLRACAELPPFPLRLLSLASGAGSGCFCYLLGGRLPDCIAAFVCGLLLQIFLSVYGKKKNSRFMHTILGSLLVTSLSVVMSRLPGLSLDHMIIGAIIPLVPGVAITTSIRDFFNGDFLSGNIHMIDAILTGVCIAVGVGSALRFWEFVAGGGILP